ncbi:TlpA disulfide reductase family protein [Kaistia dalseonensis]|uniref:Thiol-disulfide isomerase/thioredoxin n=1 Tax=Kaistia dalseonensis TaxID=410840 RepID=A0ABU0H6L8_9HYPH|nr:TlpA disulfide reductase family protein [Kaistia dalseonensis]MCX5494579.1 TlpA disulfide reductase family protein [Kaistia dalseonensis]MDQ0437159.1 thiol-disulfide isomerase/thioredoxin [Kaistia dalseonensis]
MDETRGKTRLRMVIGVAAIAGIAAGLAAVYVSGALDGNGGDQASADCAPAVKAAGLLAPLAKGDVAAFQVATEPVSLHGLSFQKADGSKATIGDFAGKTVLLNLWATWCAPCRKEMPALDRLEASKPGDDFSVVAVSIDTQDPAKPKQFLDEIGVKALDFYGDPTTGIFSGLKSRAMAVGLPTTVLIDRKGCALGVMSGPAEWDSEDAKALIAAARTSV